MNQEQQKQQYTKNYEEFRILGRGSYGSAFLVRNNIDGVYYVAKKMMLEGMSQKDVASAWGQIEILKKFNDLKIPFIVEYKECYHFDNILIIVMEYCEHGDLATFIKNWKKKGELLDQRIVVNWFIQLLFGVKALHSKNVLHRDLKAANVFLTSNKTLKIGDFGISKVLDNTSAKTFVGTPYYLSPEVCQNRPYNLSSDLWSLGCIIYQMCTLNYPFQASNLLGLAMKILSDDVKPISTQYSKELNSIVMKLFIKDEKKRITINQIFQSPIIKAHMKTFVQDQQEINKLINIGKKNVLKQEQQSQKNGSTNSMNNQSTMKTINSEMVNTKGQNDTLNYSQSLTPKQRLQLKKQEQIRKRQQQLKQATLNNASLRNFAKEKKYETLASSGSEFNKSNRLERQFQDENKQRAQMNKTRNKLQKIQVINTHQLCQTLNKIKQTMKTKDIKFQDIPLQQQFANFTLSSSTLKSTYINSMDERPIKPLGKKTYEIAEEINDDIQQYNDNDELQEYYDEAFEEYIQEQEPHYKATATREQFQEIKAFYEHQIDNGSMSPTKKNKIAETFKTEKIQVISVPQKKMSNKINQCIELIGQKRYKDLYNDVKKQKIDYKGMKSKYSQNEIKAIKLIDQIVYYENF